MKGRVPQFLFHFPHSGKMINYEELQKKAKKMRNVDKKIVDVKEINGATEGKRIGTFPIPFALIKFR